MSIIDEIDNWIFWIIESLPGKVGQIFRQKKYRKRFKYIGADVAISNNVKILFHNNLSISSHSSVNKGSFINAIGQIDIGEDVIIGPNVIIHSANHKFDSTSVPIRNQGHDHKKVTIGNDVWIGGGAIILPGVRIGEGSVVAAGAVVTKDVEKYSVVGGVPARVLYYRKSKGE